MNALLGNQHEALDRLERAAVFVRNTGLELKDTLRLICLKCGGIKTKKQHEHGCPKEPL